MPARVGADSAATAPSAEQPGAKSGLAKWLAPESWGATLVGVAKQTVLFSATFYTLLRLMGDDIRPRQAILTGLLLSAMSTYARRKGTMIASKPMLVTGALTLGVMAIGAATSLVAGQPISEALSFAGLGGLLGGIMLWMGFRARRSERELDAGMATERAAPVLVDRDELRARLTRLEDEQRPAARRVIRWFGVGLGAWFGVIAFPYQRVFGADLPEWSWMLLLFGFWGSVGLALRATSRQQRAFAERHGLVCSACDKPYFGTFGNTRLMKNLAEAGHCPQCGARIVKEDSE